jgi:DNA-binding CsgD family transcriptional regulator
MEVETALSSFYTANTDESVFDRVKSLANRVGFRDVVVSLQKQRSNGDRQTVSFETSFPIKWQEKTTGFDVVAYREDPILRHFSKRTDAIVWDEDTYSDKRLYEQFFGYGIGSGLAVALTLRNGHQLCVGFSQESARHHEASAIPAQVAALLLATTVLSVDERFAQDTEDDEALLSKLTEAERETLKWASQGKSSWAISALRNVSHSTVRNQLSSVREKLGVATTMQAVALMVKHNRL